MDSLDFSDLTDDQLMGLIRAALAEAVSRGEAVARAAHAVGLDAAERLPGTIEVVYCGPDSDAQALDFLRRLARLGGGSVVRCDLVRDRRARLAPALRTVLGLPAPRRSHP